jgi:hypothetical protein
MFAAHERHKRIVAEHEEQCLAGRLDGLKTDLIDQFDAAWDAVVAGQSTAAIEAAIAAAIERSAAPLPKAPFDSPAAVKYRPEPGEHDGRRLAQYQVAHRRRQLDKLASVGKSMVRLLTPHAAIASDISRQSVRRDLLRRFDTIIQEPMRPPLI